ncbi:fumarylacetoacetate hydrolase [Elstera litoralis]|uniref:Fumarylacetoacetate hydrolase n=1 Tax=Elstera litoralis TaxID=552518 RepID=A0A0F3IWX2_9PROT|nr:fumarylacetoacetate hydrolase family protein [Elstera litoralis]KJV10089.1 fumarylacetoacetate hydrolase [Elstera litoralis]
MTHFAFPPAAQASVAIAGEPARFPVRRIYCVGRNYAEHSREMGHNPEKEVPFFFSKPADAVVETGATIPYPPETQNLHHEIELVIAIRVGGADIPVDRALSHVFGYGVGIDLTRRDLQGVAKAAGRPWDLAKGFDLSAPIAPLHRADNGATAQQGRIWLAVNGVEKQSGDLTDMIWPVADIIAFLSRSVTLQPGDLIMTGTPAGVGPLVPGDQVTGGIDGLGAISLTIAAR